MRHKWVFIASIFLLASTLLLSGVTIANWMDSHDTLRQFEIYFLDIRQIEAPHEFEVDLLMENPGDVPTVLKSTSVALYKESKLIAASRWAPDNFEIPAQTNKEVDLNLESNLDLSYLEELDDTADNWEIRLRMEVTHRLRTDNIILTQNIQLTR